MGKIQGVIPITGTKDDKYIWKPKKGYNEITIHINGFSDLHRKFVRCQHCNGAYQSQSILQKHVLQYHYKKSKSTAVPSVAKGESSKEERKRVIVPSTSSSSCSSGVVDLDSDESSDDLIVGSSSAANRNKKVGFKELKPNSDYSDEACGMDIDIDRSILDDGLSLEEMKNWLKRNRSPIHKFKSYIFKTYDMRMEDIRQLNIKDFIKEWPLYFDHFGLYDYDFKRKIRKDDNMTQVWPNLSNSIIAFAGGEERLKSTLGINVTRLSQEEKGIASMMILPNLIKSVRSKESSEYFSATESRNAFYRVVPHDPALAQKYGLKTSRRAPEQPFILVTGKLSSLEMQSYHVVMDGVLISCTDFLQAADCCFKCYWIFDCEYPKEAEQIWSFLSCIIYSMDAEKRLNTPTQKLLQKLF